MRHIFFIHSSKDTWDVSMSSLCYHMTQQLLFWVPTPILFTIAKTRITFLNVLSSKIVFLNFHSQRNSPHYVLHNSGTALQRTEHSPVPQGPRCKAQPHHWQNGDRGGYYPCASLVKLEDQIKNIYTSNILSNFGTLCTRQCRYAPANR